jgi:hypothetical protein
MRAQALRAEDFTLPFSPLMRGPKLDKREYQRFTNRFYDLFKHRWILPPSRHAIRVISRFHISSNHILEKVK